MTRVAAIDCGTNSIRLLVTDVPATGAHTDLLRRMEVVRLGQGVDATGRLAPEAIERPRRVLAEYAAHYNMQRPHRALQLQPPRPRSPVPEPVLGKIRRRPVLGGLINQYESAA